MTIQTVFKRTERKYIITLNQRKQLLELISSQICSDKFGESTVRSLYFDTDDFPKFSKNHEYEEVRI